MPMKSIKRSPHQALLTEVLPYELPLPFSTQGLNRYLEGVGAQVVLDPETLDIRYKRRLSTVDKSILSLFWDCRLFENQVGVSQRKVEANKRSGWKHKIKTKRQACPPIQIESLRHSGSNRVLSVIHPRAMVMWSAFYNRYDTTLLDLCNRSNFSIRKPVRRVRMTRVPIMKSLFPNLHTSSPLWAELSGSEQRSVSSYFIYENHVRIGDFYDSSEFLDCEKRFRRQLRFDVSKCFDSIYTHSISWATLGQNEAKAHRSSADWAPGPMLDQLMQNTNYGETNGIVVGPEFSRIFAEIILQTVDSNVERDLRKVGLKHGREYRAFRYVDDYFVFAQDERTLEQIGLCFERHLRFYKLSLNEAKAVHLARPYITPISIAKNNLKNQVSTLASCTISPLNDTPELVFRWKLAIRLFQEAVQNSSSEDGMLVNYALGAFSNLANDTLNEFLDGQHAKWSSSSASARPSGISRISSFISNYYRAAIHVFSYGPSTSSSIILADSIAKLIHTVSLVVDQNAILGAVRSGIIEDLKGLVQMDLQSHGIRNHMLPIVDLLSHFNTPLGLGFLSSCTGDSFEHPSIDSLVRAMDSIALLTWVRNVAKCGATDGASQVLLSECKRRIKSGESDMQLKADRVILRCSLADCPHFESSALAEIVGLDAKDVRRIQKRRPYLFWDWDIDRLYVHRFAERRLAKVY